MDRMNRMNRTELHHAALENRVNDVEDLIAAGGDVSAADKQGFTPLHFAAQQNSVESARLLITAGADVNALNIHGNSPLWTATYEDDGSGTIIRMLRDAGADPRHPNSAGQTPVGLARLIASKDVRQFYADLD